MYIKWNNKKYKLIGSVDMTQSSQEVTYSDFTVDFSKAKIDDLPYAQQEVNVYDDNDNVKYMGFVSEYKLPELNKIKTPNKELSLTLFSPRQMATKKTVTINRTDTVENLVRQALEPLFVEGFYIKEMNISRQATTVNLISRTVEEVLNYFSKRFELYWNIDELKGITVNSIQYQFSKNVKKKINIKNYKQEINGLLSISPTITNLDYANIINVKNARIFYEMDSVMNVTLNNGDRLDFENPIDISTATTKRIYEAIYVQGSTVTGFPINIHYNSNLIANIMNTVNYELPDKQVFTDIGKDDSDNKLFTLTMDSTFKNLATGITYKGEGSVTITEIQSDSALRYANMKLLNWQEINRMKGIITPSGQIEKVLDVDSGWFTESEMVNYVRNYFGINDNYTNQVTLKYDKDNDLDVGDRIDIDLPEYFTSGEYVITSIKESKEGNNPSNFSVELRNTAIVENYIDLFRSSADTEENDSQTQVEYLCEYTTEGIKEVHTVELTDNDRNHTLNFGLNR